MNPRFRWYILALLVVALIALANVGWAQVPMRHVTDVPEIRNHYGTFPASMYAFVAVQLPDDAVRVIVARGASKAVTSPAAAQDGWSIIPVRTDNVQKSANNCFAIYLTMDTRGKPFASACVDDLPDVKRADLSPMGNRLAVNRLSISSQLAAPAFGICLVNGAMTYTNKLPCESKADAMYAYPCDGVNRLPHCDPPPTMIYKSSQFYIARGCKACRVTDVNTTRVRFDGGDSAGQWRWVRVDTGEPAYVTPRFFRLPENDDR